MKLFKPGCRGVVQDYYEAAHGLPELRDMHDEYLFRFEDR